MNSNKMIKLLSSISEVFKAKQADNSINQSEVELLKDLSNHVLLLRRNDYKRYPELKELFTPQNILHSIYNNNGLEKQFASLSREFYSALEGLSLLDDDDLFYSEHAELINEGVDLHNDDKLEEARKYFERAYKLAPHCPSVLYNLADNYLFLDRFDESLALIDELLQMSNEDAELGCEDHSEHLIELRLPAYFVKFRAMLLNNEPWNKAYINMKHYWEIRETGIESVFEDAEVEATFKEFKSIFYEKE